MLDPRGQAQELLCTFYQFHLSLRKGAPLLGSFNKEQFDGNIHFLGSPRQEIDAGGTLLRLNQRQVAARGT